jgi:D-glycerate 3-kinase
MGKRFWGMNPIATRIAEHVVQWRTDDTPLIIGICGPQASGKSTAAAQVAAHLSQSGLTVASLSLDDLYRGRDARRALAARTHPLFATRGPPGTHDIALGLDVLTAIKAGVPVRLPRFCKGHDAPLPQDQWPVLGRCDVLLFEGWCIGAQPETEAALVAPVNALERDKDADGAWRRAVNTHLAEATGDLFALIDRLIYLQPPSFDVVYQWRCEQEHALIAKGNAPAAMSDPEIRAFISHYERLTRHMIIDMPKRADLVIRLGSMREILS